MFRISRLPTWPAALYMASVLLWREQYRLLGADSSACLVIVADRRWSASVTAFVKAVRAHPWSHEPPVASVLPPVAPPEYRRSGGGPQWIRSYGVTYSVATAEGGFLSSS